MFDDDDDDLYDIDSPEGLSLAYADGWLDGNENCACWCGCSRSVETGGDTCPACLAERHYNPSDPGDNRR